MLEELKKIREEILSLEASNYEIGYGDALKVTSAIQTAERQALRKEVLDLLDTLIAKEEKNAGN